MNGPDAALRSLVGFARALRGSGVAATPDRVQALVRALSCLDAASSSDVYWAGRVTLCSGPDDLPRYDRVFAFWFGGAPPPAVQPIQVVEAVRDVMVTPADDATRSGPNEQPRAEAASDLEVLRHKDFTLLSDLEQAQIRKMLAMLAIPAPLRASRRRKPGKSGELDARRTVRSMLERGGEPSRIRYHDHTSRPRRIVLLLDVSGSMSGYSDILLRYAHVCVRRRPGTEVFTLGTRLTRVTRELSTPGANAALAAVANVIADWSGGTRLGTGIKDFLDRHGQRGMARGAVVVVASDGWERGDASLLGSQMQRLHRLAHRIVWVHPHKGRPGYQPLAAGIAAALPSIDDFVAGHSLASLQDLSRLLSDRAPANEVCGWHSAGL